MYFIIFFILLIMAIQDYRKGVVSNLLFIPLLFFIKYTILSIFLFLFFLLIYKYISLFVGGADIKLLISFLGIFSVNETLIFLILSLTLALFYAFIFKEKTIRMFPFFLFSYTMVLFQ